MSGELRQVHYFIAVAEELNFTRAAERLHMAQPPLSAAIRQLEEQLGVELLRRTTRHVELTPAGRLLLEQGRELLRHADAVFADVRETERAPVGRLSVGLAPPGRFGVASELLGACAAGLPGVMLYPREDPTGTLVHELRAARLDLAVGFCAPAGDLGLERERLRDEPAFLHVRADHPLAARSSVSLAELAAETFVVAGGRGSPGYTATVLELCRSAGFEPAVVADPYPDLGLRAVHEGLGVVVYVRSFAPHVDGSAFVPIEPRVTLPFDLLWRRGARSGALAAVLDVARDLRDRHEWTSKRDAPTD